MRSESIIRYYVNVATGSLFWLTQYMSGKWGTAELFAQNYALA